MIDRILKAELFSLIRSAIREVIYEAFDFRKEKWVTGDELCKQFQMFTLSWLKRYGHKLPRTRAVVTEEDGSTHATSWTYPVNKIQRMAHEGKLSRL